MKINSPPSWGRWYRVVRNEARWGQNSDVCSAEGFALEPKRNAK